MCAHEENEVNIYNMYGVGTAQKKTQNADKRNTILLLANHTSFFPFFPLLFAISFVCCPFAHSLIPLFLFIFALFFLCILHEQRRVLFYCMGV